jgi:hypothetical protein
MSAFVSRVVATPSTSSDSRVASFGTKSSRRAVPRARAASSTVVVAVSSTTVRQQHSLEWTDAWRSMASPSTRVAFVRDAERDALRNVLDTSGLAQALATVQGEVHVRGLVRGGDDSEITSSDVASLHIAGALLRDAQVIPTGVYDAVASLEFDIASVVTEYCKVADTPRAVVELTLLRKTLCSKYHVDHVPLRVMVTYLGAGTEILSESASLAISLTSDRIGRGAGDVVKRLVGQGGGFFGQKTCANTCEVVLMKGEKWSGNAGRAIVHRSPDVDACCGEWRLTLKVDHPKHVNAIGFGIGNE